MQWNDATRLIRIYQYNTKGMIAVKTEEREGPVDCGFVLLRSGQLGGTPRVFFLPSFVEFVIEDRTRAIVLIASSNRPQILQPLPFTLDISAV